MDGPWKEGKHPLLRGDSAAGIESPQPNANPKIVRHILYLDGPGRATPYLSTTEDEESARRFAGKDGRIYSTRVPAWAALGVKHWSRTALLQLLKGRGKGDCAWPSAFEVLQARSYVEEHKEHLADFREHPDDQTRLSETIRVMFK